MAAPVLTWKCPICALVRVKYGDGCPAKNLLERENVSKAHVTGQHYVDLARQKIDKSSGKGTGISQISDEE